MSGGAYEYAFCKVNDFADSLRHTGEDPRRAAFKKLLYLVSEAMHCIEWVDSCDKGEGDDHEAIDKVFAFLKADPAVITKAHAFDALRDNLKKFMEFPG